MAEGKKDVLRLCARRLLLTSRAGRVDLDDIARLAGAFLGHPIDKRLDAGRDGNLAVEAFARVRLAALGAGDGARDQRVEADVGAALELVGQASAKVVAGGAGGAEARPVGLRAKRVRLIGENDRRVGARQQGRRQRPGDERGRRHVDLVLVIPLFFALRLQGGEGKQIRRAMRDARDRARVFGQRHRQRVGLFLRKLIQIQADGERLGTARVHNLVVDGGKLAFVSAKQDNGCALFGVRDADRPSQPR